MSYSKNPAISKGIDWLTVWLFILITIVGLLCIFSVEYRSSDNVMQQLLAFKKSYSKQFIFFGICIVLAIFILLTDSKLFTALANLSYLGGLLLMMATFVVGKSINGSRSWIPMGFMNLQPVEVCKIFTCLALAKYMSQAETDFRKPRSQMIAACIAFAPILFSLMQNETGLALVYFSFLFPMYREGLPAVYLVVGASLAVLLVVTILLPAQTLVIAFTVIALLYLYIMRRQVRRNRSLLVAVAGIFIACTLFVGVAVPFLFKHVFQSYQADRIFSMFGVDNRFADAASTTTLAEAADAKAKKEDKEDYNVKQSKIAIGSGGFWGKGFLKGTQTQGDFVPAQSTDFIFTSVGENFGFWGSGLVMLLYFGLLLRIVFLAERQRSTFSRVYAYGVAGIFFIHVSINICMTIGLAPVIGITLPMMSYGGSSLLTFTTLVFILIKLDADRQMILR